MEPMIESLVSFIAKAGLQPSETKRVSEVQSEYIIIWDTSGPRKNGIRSYTLTFLFDMDSFLVRYREMFPERHIDESFVLTGIAHLFKEVAALVLIMGSQGYDELAAKLHQHRGAIGGIKYGI